MVTGSRSIISPLSYKIHIPVISGNILRRQRLIDLLHRTLNTGIQIMYAPAGYGKTTLLADFCHDLDIPVCWYTLDRTDVDIVGFVNGIIESVRIKFPDFGNPTRFLLSATERSLKFVSQLADVLSRDMRQEIPDYFLLVLEDYHTVAGSDVGIFLDVFFNQMPENCHILISSRTVIDIPAIHTRAVHGRTHALTLQELAFTTDEIKALIEHQKGPELSIKVIDRLVRENEGWIVGLLLNIEGFRSGEKIGETSLLTREDVFSFLASEIYERLPSDIQNFLLKSSVLDQLDPEYCDYLLGIKHSAKMLHDIQGQNVFVSIVQTERPCYRYHPLFRDFLREKLIGTDEKEYRRLHTRAALHFRMEKHWPEAVEHYLAAKQYSQARDVIKESGQAMINAGKWTSVSQWISALPVKYRLQDQELLLLQSQCDIHIGHLDSAILGLTRVITPGTTPGIWLLQARALSCRSAAYRLAGNPAAALKDIKASISYLVTNHGPSDILGDAYRRLGTLHLDQGNLTVALQYLKRALHQYSATLNIEQSAAIHNSLGVAYRELGKLTESAMHLDLARQGWQKVGNKGTLASVLNNLGLVYQCQGDFDRALKMFRLGLQNTRESGYRRIEACLLISTADLLRDACLYDEALTMYEEGLKVAEEIMEIYYMVCAIAGSGETQRLIGNKQKAEVLLQQAVSLAQEHNRSYEAAVFSMRLGIIKYERGEYEKALSIFSEIMPYIRKIGDKDALARTYFHIAQTMFLSRRYTEAKDYLLKASQITDELGYDTLFAIEGKNSLLLLQYAASEGIGGKTFHHALDFIRNSRDEDILQILPEFKNTRIENSRPDISVYGFGEVKVIVNGREIPESEWRSHRALEMFFFLLSSRTSQTREQIAAAIWPDLSPSKSTSNFHISLYRARQALFPGLVTLHEGRYQIAPDIGIWYDVNEFVHITGRFNHSTIMLASEADLLQKAIDLYSGPFLVTFYSDWVESLRIELEGKYLKALRTLTRYYCESGDPHKAVGALEKIIVNDPFNDDLLTDIETWNIPANSRLTILHEYHRYLNRLRNKEVPGSSSTPQIGPGIRRRFSPS